VSARKFDWDKALELRARGAPIAAIARILGVSVTAVRMAVVPGSREEARDRKRRWQAIGQELCEECDGPRSRNDSADVRHCLACSIKLRRTSVREDALRCSVCREWLPDDRFYRSNISSHAARRGRRRDCKACNDARSRPKG